MLVPEPGAPDWAYPLLRCALAGPVRVQASLNVQEVAKKAATFAATLPALVAASPAFALVRCGVQALIAHWQ